MENAVAGVDVTLSTFGGLATELSPSDLPDGGSPDNQDCAYEPGSVLARPGLSRVYPNPPSPSPIVFQQSFTRKDGQVINVLMDSTGSVWFENQTTSPGSFGSILTVGGGTKYCKAVESNGRLYMAFNDGLRGTDVPRVYDGVTLSRVGQGGPCGNPSYSEFIASPVALGNSSTTGSVAVTSLISTDQTSYTVRVRVTDTDLSAHGAPQWEDQTVFVYNSIQITVASVALFSIGQAISLSGNTAFNGSNLVITSIDAIGLKIKVAWSDSTLYSGAGGTIGVSAPTLSRADNIVTASTAVAHTLAPGDMVTVSGVTNTTIGTGISTAVRQSNIATITTSAANGVRVGSRVIIAGVTDTTFNGTWDVTGVVSSVAFQVTSSNLTDATSSGGTVSDNWNNSKRFVSTVPSATTFTYSEIGPDDQTTNSGTVTPVGQVAGGLRNAVCMFQTINGFITPPSDPIQVATSGNKKLTLTNIPIGPSNIAARIIAFTLIDGSKYFYIPVPARSGANVVSSATTVNDNTSTTAMFDFSDETLASATPIDVDGNDLFNLRILGNAAGVTKYADRTLWWGDENYAINFKNMGFEGGINADGTPMGWAVTGTGINIIPNAGAFGDALQFDAGSNAIISQSCYLDYYGDKIIEPNTQYTFKCWAAKLGTGVPILKAEIFDTNTTTVLSSASITLGATPGFQQADFTLKTGATIPSTAVLRVYLQDNLTAPIMIDELKLIYTRKPYNDTQFATSYINNPESIDGTSGYFGASNDSLPIMDAGTLRDNFYFITNGKNGRLHTTKNTNSEPSGWDVNEIAQKCGACTMQSMISGESWLSWVSVDGARMFDGGMPQKITQDIQDRWDLINSSALSAIWAVNDTTKRRIYWGVPLNGSTLTNAVYQLDYRYMETAAELEDRGSIRQSAYTGKMLVLELSRKFSPWTIPATAGGFLTTANGLEVCFSNAVGRTYRLDPTKLADDDYGTIPAYYVTSPFPSSDQEQELQLGAFRHLCTYMEIFIYGTGQLTITPMAEALSNVWPARGPYPLSTDPQSTIAIPLNVSAGMAFFKFQATPTTGLNAAFSLSRMVVKVMPHPTSPVRGK